MEVILVLNGGMVKRPGFERHPPEVTFDKWGNGGFSYEYGWTVMCESKVVLRDAYEVDMQTVKEIEDARGNLQLGMSVIGYPEDYHTENMSGDAFAVMNVRDVEGVIRRVLDLIPRQSFDMYVEVKYLESVLNFSHFAYDNGLAKPKWTGSDLALIA